LSKGTFRWWPKRSDTDGVLRFDVHQLQLLLWNGNPFHVEVAPAWRSLPLAA
jgi:hypothetical protein